ncbi:MAG: polysaccharide deacetylase family protein [bacterium]|nr:polysaccharide deacetylase family protein [bacterium]
MGKIILSITLLIIIFSLQFVPSSYSGEIALSFDDAPTNSSAYFTGEERTRELIRKLNKAKVKEVIFFCNTAIMDKKGKERLISYAKQGHILANHTHTHPKLFKIGTSNFIENIIKADKILSHLPNFVKLFRFPYLNDGNTKIEQARIKIALENMSYKHGYVTVDTYDWYMNKLFCDAVKSGKEINFQNLKQAYIKNLWETIIFYDQIAIAVLGRSPKHIMLLHENDLAALFIDDFIKFIEQKNWKIISPTEAYNDPISKIYPDVVMPQGLITKLGKAANYTGRIHHPSESKIYIDEYFKYEQVFK